jgi:hypothetical protein
MFFLGGGFWTLWLSAKNCARTMSVCVCVCGCVCVCRYLINFFVSLWFACRKKKNQNEKKIRDPCVCLTRWQNKSCFHRNGSKEKLDGGRVVCDVTDASVPLGWTHLSNASLAHTDPDNTRLKSETGQHSWFGVALHLLPIRFRRAGPADSQHWTR